MLGLDRVYPIKLSICLYMCPRMHAYNLHSGCAIYLDVVVASGGALLQISGGKEGMGELDH